LRSRTRHKFLADRGTEVVGVDLSVVMLEVARERAPGTPFVAGSIIQLPLIDGA
jgi:ubiquinone/menaquinone biosynthesis C-methylase UbiE